MASTKAPAPKPWSISRDTFDPLIAGLTDIRTRMFVSWEPNQAPEQRTPPNPHELGWLLVKCRVGWVATWLQVNQPNDVGEEFKTRLDDAASRFSSIDFRACQILADDLQSNEVVWVRNAIAKLDRHQSFALRELFPAGRPEIEEMPEPMRLVETDVLQPYGDLHFELGRLIDWLAQLKNLLLAKHKSDGEWIGPKSPTEWRREFGISESTFRRMIKAGEIRVDPVTTKSIRIRREDVERLTAKES